MIVVGPALEAHFGDDPGLDPGRRRILLGHLGEWTRAPFERGQSRLHLRERALVEARADVRRVAELAPVLSPVPVADEDRAERRARTLALRVAADDEVRALRRLHLHPRCRTPAGFVAAVLALRDHAFEPARERRRLQRSAVFHRMHELDAGRRQQALGEIAAAIPIRRTGEIDPGEMRHVEAVEDHRGAPVGGGNLPLRLQLGALLQRAERRLAGAVERDDLAVEDHSVDRLLAELRGEQRKLRRELESAARAQLDAVLVDEREHAVAVELRLPHPVGTVERRVARFGEHRREPRRHRHDLARRNELRGAYPVRRHDLEVLDRHGGEDRAVPKRDIDGRREAVLVLQQEPLLRFPGSHQRERSLELLSAQQEAQLALGEAFPYFALRRVAVVEPGGASFIGRIDAAIPDDHFARAVLARWNHAFERGIVERMILGLHGQSFLARVERRPFGNGPRLQDAVAFETEVVVQPPRRVLLDDEQQRAAGGGAKGRRRLGGGRERPFGRIFGQAALCHAGILAMQAASSVTRIGK